MVLSGNGTVERDLHSGGKDPLKKTTSCYVPYSVLTKATPAILVEPRRREGYKEKAGMARRPQAFFWEKNKRTSIPTDASRLVRGKSRG